ncbi:MAG: Fe-S cluster assembly protein SufD [Ignavibacteria bacterium]|nr:Fe-S cluster assembly protein SufD [Ignavibacteria bacterium]
MGFIDNVSALFEKKFSKQICRDEDSERLVFFEKFKELGLPTIKNEDWKYTNLAFLNEINFQLSSCTKAIDTGLVEKYLSFLNGNDKIVVPYINNSIDESFVKPLSSFDYKILRNGSFFANTKLISKFSNFFDSSNPFNFLTLAFSTDSAYLNVNNGFENEIPIILFYLYDFEINTLSNTLSFVEVEEDAKINIIAIFINRSRDKVFANEIINFHLKRNSNVEVNILQFNIDNLVLIDNFNFILESGATLKINTFSLNNYFVRNNLNVLFNEPYGTAFLNGIYFTADDEFVDNHTLVLHNQPNCISDENFRGILDGTGRAVFNGKIYVARDAQKTNAYQSNKNLLLSNDARINTRPQLEIYADDVRCTHGATAGYLDQEMLFYIVSRGISKEKAKSLLLNSFVSENLEKVEQPDLRNFVKELVAKKLNLEDIFFCSAIDELTNASL